MSTSSTPVPSTTAAKKPLVSMLRTPTDPRRAKIAKQLLAKRGYSTQFKRPLDRLVALDAKLTEFISIEEQAAFNKALKDSKIQHREETPTRWANKGAILGGLGGVAAGIHDGRSLEREIVARDVLNGKTVTTGQYRRRVAKTAAQASIGYGALGVGAGAALGGIAGLIKRRGQRNDDTRRRIEQLTSGTK